MTWSQTLVWAGDALVVWLYAGNVRPTIVSYQEGLA